MPRREQPEDDRHPKGEQEAEHDELQRARQAFGNLLDDGAVGPDRIAKVAPHHAGHVGAVLLDEGPVETVACAGAFDVLRGCGLGNDGEDGIAGQHPDEQETEDADAHQDGRQHQQPSRYVETKTHLARAAATKTRPAGAAASGVEVSQPEEAVHGLDPTGHPGGDRQVEVGLGEDEPRHVLREDLLDLGEEERCGRPGPRWC